MTEQQPDPTPRVETSNCDPSLGPNDVRLELKLSLFGQKGILVRSDALVNLSNALSLASRGGVAAAVETGVELMVQNALTQISELILQKCQKEQTGQHGPAARIDEYRSGKPPKEYPDVLPPPPAK